MIRLPGGAAPDVSVILVTYNGWEATRDALRSLVDETASPYEVVIVDNGSVDGTVAGLESLKGATVLRNGRNLGFGPACNQGASLARGRHLVFLNNDTRVRGGWLAPLVASADADPTVGAVAPRLVYPDGRLQEAGSILWRNGRVRNYGDGDTPDRPQYLFRRTVDYASAACLLVPRRIFALVGGFDPRYVPAYCEDVDLCLGLAAGGWRVLFEPSSVVEHARGTSAGDAARRAFLARNRPLLRARWRDVLDRRPPESWYAEPSAVIGGRDAMTAERVLVLASRLPADAGGAGGQGPDGCLGRLLRTCAGTWPGARWTVAALDPTDAARRAAHLGAAGVEPAWGEKDWPAWLRGRRHHYGIVVMADPRWADGDLGGAVSAAQPVADRVRLDLDGARLELGDGSAVALAPESDRGGQGLRASLRQAALRLGRA